MHGWTGCRLGGSWLGWLPVGWFMHQLAAGWAVHAPASNKCLVHFCLNSQQITAMATLMVGVIPGIGDLRLQAVGAGTTAQEARSSITCSSTKAAERTLGLLVARPSMMWPHPQAGCHTALVAYLTCPVTLMVAVLLVRQGHRKKPLRLFTSPSSLLCGLWQPPSWGSW